MIDWFLHFDLTLFHLGNSTLANPVGDVIFPFITEVKNMYIPYAVALCTVMIAFGKRGILVVALALVAVTIGDQLNSFVLKPWFDRLRPCATLEQVRLLVGCGGGKSFPSSHAVNNFAAAMVFSLYFRKALPYLMVFAGLVAYSRVYVGVHYPSDIITGALLGILIGFTVVWIAGNMTRMSTTWRST